MESEVPAGRRPWIRSTINLPSAEGQKHGLSQGHGQAASQQPTSCLPDARQLQLGLSNGPWKLVYWERSVDIGRDLVDFTIHDIPFCAERKDRLGYELVVAIAVLPSLSKKIRIQDEYNPVMPALEDNIICRRHIRTNESRDKSKSIETIYEYTDLNSINHPIASCSSLAVHVGEFGLQNLERPRPDLATLAIEAC